MSMKMAPQGARCAHSLQSNSTTAFLGILQSKGPCPIEPGGAGMSLRGHYTRMRFGPRRGHYTRMRFGPQVALPHLFTRPIHRIYSKWYKPLVVPKFTRQGKHFNFQPSPPGACTTLDGAAQRHHFIVRPALPTGADLQGSPPSLRPSRTSRSHPISTTMVQWVPGISRARYR